MVRSIVQAISRKGEVFTYLKAVQAAENLNSND